MSVVSNSGKHGHEVLAFVIFAVSWVPYFVAKYDLWKNGPGEGTGFEGLLAVFWLCAFLAVGTVYSLYAIGLSEKRHQSPTMPFVAVSLNVISILTLFYWFLEAFF